MPVARCPKLGEILIMGEDPVGRAPISWYCHHHDTYEVIPAGTKLVVSNADSSHDARISWIAMKSFNSHQYEIEWEPHSEGWGFWLRVSILEES